MDHFSNIFDDIAFKIVVIYITFVALTIFSAQFSDIKYIYNAV